MNSYVRTRPPNNETQRNPPTMGAGLNRFQRERHSPSEWLQQAGGAGSRRCPSRQLPLSCGLVRRDDHGRSGRFFGGALLGRFRELAVVTWPRPKSSRVTCPGQKGGYRRGNRGLLYPIVHYESVRHYRSLLCFMLWSPAAPAIVNGV